MSLIKTLATGILTNKRRGIYSFKPKNALGFTLIELLTVVLIVSIIIGAGVLSVSVGDRGRVQEVMRNTVSMMNAMADEAILSGRRYAMAWDGKTHNLRPLCRNEEQQNWECNKSCFPDGCENITVSLQNSWKLLFQDQEGSEFNPISDVINQNAEEQADEQYLDEDDPDYQNSQRRKQWRPLVQFHPTGLWEPSGTMRIIFDDKQYLSLNWTATGRVRFGEPKPY